MSRFELSISPDYVQEWGIWEGVRELLQNMIDREIEGGARILSYESSGRMIIGNKNTPLAKSTLLLGMTSKSDKRHIGKFGEGYKLAFIALIRHGIRLSIMNAGENWTPRFVKSRKYDSKHILVIDTEKGDRNNRDLYFILEGVRPDMYSEIVQNYLGLCEVGNNIACPQGRILLEDRFKGRIFIAGLFVCKINEKIKYGYDMFPGHIELDRDRKKVESFNLFWETSQMYASLEDPKYAETIHGMVHAGCVETQFYHSHYHVSDELFKAVCELSATEFLKSHGRTAVPVKTEEEAEFIKERYNDLVPVVVPEQRWHYLSNAPSLSENRDKLRTQREEDTPYRFIEKFLKKHESEIDANSYKLITDELLPESHHWQYRKGESTV